MAHVPALASVSGDIDVPHYDGAAVVEGSLIFLLIIALVAAIAFKKRR
ncbi:MAG TPA: hypothetical protein VFN97_15690 [Actinospica sp.]|nr:hypothetical protein [Actinospica sp.]